MGIIPLAGLFCTLYASVAYGATTTVTIGVGDTKLIIQGRSAPGSFITIMDGGNVIGTVIADNLGAFTKPFPAVTPGIHQLQIYSRDNDSRLSDVIRIQVDANEHTETTINAFLPPSISASHTTAVRGEIVQYNGSTIPNGAVSLIIDDAPPIALTADANGRWSYALATADLSLGAHAASVLTTDTATTAQSYSSQKQQLQIIETAAESPSGPQHPGPPATDTPGTTTPTTISPLPDATVTDNEVIIEGTAPPYSQITLYNDGKPVGSTFADQYGRWRIVFTLEVLEYTIRAQACLNGSCNPLSEPMRFFYQPPDGREPFYARADLYTNVIAVNQPLPMHVHIIGGVSPFTIATAWGDGKQQTMQRRSRDNVLSHSYAKTGQYAGTIHVTDADNRSSTIMFSALVIGQSEQFSLTWLLVLVPCFLLLFGGIGRYALWRLHHHHTRHKA